jgi:signal transduction histidine kinase/CheY-like chemotaxis protein/HPt (histidine-containing phosphotransfer) domain-containing protein
MEMIEVAPLLDQVHDKGHGLEALMQERYACLAHKDRECLVRMTDGVDLFLKQVPPLFERLTENANRLFFDSSQRVAALDAQLVDQKERLRKIEMGLVAFVILLAGVVSVTFLRRISDAGYKLEAAVVEMRAAKDAAERASQAKTEFVSRMSHELRTPLNAIIGFADLLEDEPLAPSHKHYVGLINNSGKHLMELINAVLDHAKIEAGGLTLENIAYDFAGLVESVRQMVGERANAKGLQFVASIAPGLPRYVQGDPTRLRQVLINLLNNAVKFTEQGSVELRVAAEDERLYFSVRDTGIGMDEQALVRLFQPFSQADDSVTRKFGGTGLGLLISKELVEAMGGAIDVESAKGVGTVFLFWLPLRVAGAPTSAVTTATSASHENIAPRVAGRVLLVDDNRVNQQLAGAMLDRLGLSYDSADDGRSALRRLEAGNYALVLMDMEMPEMDGITATREIRAREATEGKTRLPVVAMTANALQEDRERCFAAGMDGYLAKPVSLAALQAELQRLFGSTPVAAAAVAPDAGGPKEGALFDRATAIDRMGDASLFDELAGMFVADVPGHLAEMDQALAAGDSDRLGRVAHTLKGLCATFAAAAAEAAAKRVEQQARAGMPTDEGAATAELRRQIEALAAALTGK